MSENQKCPALGVQLADSMQVYYPTVRLLAWQMRREEQCLTAKWLC
jgi:hypothetical protein